MDAIQPQHNLNALVIGTGEFSFCESAASVAATLLAGWLSFGNIVAMTPEKQVESQEHFGSYRGTRILDKTIDTQASVEYSIRCDEWNYKLLELLFGASSTTAFTQSAQAAVSADALAFSGGSPSGTSKWYDIKVSGARIMNVTALTIATLTEGTDFVVDTRLGRIRFLTNQTASRTPVVTAAAVTSSDAGYMLGMTPLANLRKTGYGRLTLYDQNTANPIVLDHRDFSCEVSAESSGEVDGQNFSEITIRVRVTSEVGTLYVRKQNDN